METPHEIKVDRRLMTAEQLRDELDSLGEFARAEIDALQKQVADLNAALQIEIDVRRRCEEAREDAEAGLMAVSKALNAAHRTIDRQHARWQTVVGNHAEERGWRQRVQQELGRFLDALDEQSLRPALVDTIREIIK